MYSQTGKVIYKMSKMSVAFKAGMVCLRRCI